MREVNRTLIKQMIVIVHLMAVSLNQDTVHYINMNCRLTRM